MTSNVLVSVELVVCCASGAAAAAHTIVAARTIRTIARDITLSMASPGYGRRRIVSGPRRRLHCSGCTVRCARETGRVSEDFGTTMPWASRYAVGSAAKRGGMDERASARY